MPDSAPLVRQATAQDATLLAELGARTFSDAFAKDNKPEDVKLYLARAFTPEQMTQELADPAATFFLVHGGDEAVGFAKLKVSEAPACVDGQTPIEIERIYVDQVVLGRGMGAALMRACLDKAAHDQHDVVWLGVWEHNDRAHAFYRKWGFKEVGFKTFTVGTDVQHDRVMVRMMDNPAPASS